MGAVAVAQWQTSHKFAGTFTSAELHFHAVADVVWRKSEIGSGASPLSTIGSSSAKYNVLAQEYKTFDDAGTERYADSTGIQAVCAGSPYTGDAQLDDTTTPFFYLVQRVAGNDRALVQLLHETDLYNEAKAEALITANVGSWVG